MNEKYKKLFEPASIGKLKLKNRMSMAPMGPVGYADPFGGFNQRIQDYYVERAKGGIGLIITGLCSVDTTIEGIPPFGIPCPTANPLAFIHSATQMNERVHAYGTKIIVQLTGGLGRSALPGFASKNIAPSEQENRFDPRVIHREMTEEEIQKMIKKFVESAVICKRAGFDGVEIHAVHEGYLLDQFAIAFYNKRTDKYGGTLENRLRVAIEIVQGIKKACGKDFPVSLRYSLKSMMKGLRQGALPGEEFTEAGRDIEEGIEAAKILVKAGYDALNVDAGTYDSWYWNHPPMYFEYEGMYREFGELLMKEVDVPIILAGRMEDPDIAAEAIGKSCNIVSYGRQLLTDPEYPEKLRTGRLDEIRPCLGCHEGCLGRIGAGPVSCAVNPACGRETIYGLTPALRKKKILVVGGGVAGMETARVAAVRGHEVILAEKSEQLGGNVIPGGVPSFKRYHRRLIKWYERQLEILGVDVRKNTTVTKENVAEFGADEIVVATGSKPIILEGDEFKDVLVVDDVLMGRKSAGENVVIIGGGLVGCETGLWLAQQGKKVTIIERLPVILGGPHGMPFMNYQMLTELLQYHKVSMHTSTEVKEVRPNEVVIAKGEDVSTIPADTVIGAVGYKENNKLYEELRDMPVPVHNIGDSNKVQNIMYAIWGAYEVAKNL